jgi:acetyl-CoA carboxylase carboxyltransferase component
MIKDIEFNRLESKINKNSTKYKENYEYLKSKVEEYYEILEKIKLGGGEVHTKISGVADYLAENDEHAIFITRSIVRNLGKNERYDYPQEEPQDPYYDPEEIYGIIPKDLRKPFDIRELIARIVDSSYFHEFKPLYGPTLVTGFARIWGYLVGIVANNGVLFSQSALKGAHFIQLCNSRKIPIAFL